MLTTTNGFSGSAIPSRLRDSNGDIIDVGDITGSLGEIEYKAYIQDLTLSTTSSRTYQNKLSLSFTALAATYLIMWHSAVNTTNGNSKIGCRFQEDNTTTIQEIVKEGQDANVVNGFIVRTLTAGNHFYDIDWRAVQGGGSAQIQLARIMIVKMTN